MCWKIAKLEVLLDYWVFFLSLYSKDVQSIPKLIHLQIFFPFNILCSQILGTAPLAKVFPRSGFPWHLTKSWRNWEEKAQCPARNLPLTSNHATYSVQPVYLTWQRTHARRTTLSFATRILSSSWTRPWTFTGEAPSLFEMLRKWFYTKAFTSSDKVGQQKDVLLSQANWTLTHR